MSADVDRRKALAAIAVWQVAELGLWGAASPANAADDQAKLVEAALKKLCSVNPEKLPNFVCFDLKDLGVAIVDDGSPSAKAAAAAVKATGAVPILLKGDTKKMQETYRTFSSEPDGDFGIKASVAIVPNTKILKQVMAGNGLQCDNCGFGGGPTGPKWFLVLNSNGVADSDLQKEAEVSGRQCEPSGCFQVGLSVPCYGLEAFGKKKFNDVSGLFDKE